MSDLQEVFNIKNPIVQAPMAGGISTPGLVYAVSNSDALGMLGAGYLSAEQLDAQIQEIKANTTNPFGVNLFIPDENVQQFDAGIFEQVIDQILMLAQNYEVVVSPPDINAKLPNFNDQLTVVLDNKVPIVSFTFGVATQEILHILKSFDVVTVATATSVKEAIFIKDSGYDAVVIQGSEAGGHRGGFMGDPSESLLPTFYLIRDVTSKVSGIPVIAAGGIMNGASISNALMFGASGVQMGTAFIACPESGASNAYRHLIMSNNNTVLTTGVSGRLARGINTGILRQLAELASGDGVVLPYPLQHLATAGIRGAVAKNIPIEGSYWAGVNHSMARELPAAELIKHLVAEANASEVIL